MKPWFQYDRLLSPFVIFVRFEGYRDDAEILRALGRESYVLMDGRAHSSMRVVLACDGTWTMIRDDCNYSLWHDPAVHRQMETWCQTWDVFTGLIGDTDRSFAFTYSRTGQLARKFTVISPRFHDRIVSEDIGEPLPGELPNILEVDDEIEIVLGVADSLGIKTDYTEDEVRIYAKS